MTAQEINLVRDLAQQYLAICQKDVQRERRDLWRRHNSLQRTRTPVWVRAFAWQEMPQSQCVCTDPLLRSMENFFRESLFRDTFGDDYIHEPWYVVPAVIVTPPEGVWGLRVEWHASDEPRGARKWDPPIKSPEDVKRMVEPHHVVDEARTAERLARVQDAVGDILSVVLDRATVFRMWNADISTELAKLRGLEEMMWDMVDRPAWLHELLAFMRDGILQAQAEAEAAGDWRLCNHQNQSAPYALELQDPSPSPTSVRRKDLWTFCASQETTLVGPAMFNEFMLQYQIPIIANFGLAAYGCCEDLTHKIPLLRQIPNLRRIAVALTANVAKCAEQIGTDYVLSYRPSPADMVGYGWDEERVRRILRRDLEACRDCYVDITLKDVETVQGDTERVRRWVETTRSVLDELGMG